MIPILYEKDETSFNNNGLGRLYDCITCTVTEERNGIYECDFEYPITGQHFDEIIPGRIIGCEHDANGDIQPFDIVSYTRPIEGVVSFHCTHISYRQNYYTAVGSNIFSLANAIALLETAQPENPFSYWTNKTSSGYLASADGIPKSIRQLLGGVDGSILDAYGGEFEWDKFTVKLWETRGEVRDFYVRYGVNMVDYENAYDISGTYSACVPYWTDGTDRVIGSRQVGGFSTITDRGETIPLDVSEKFESKPTKAQVEAMGREMMQNLKSTSPMQTIKVSFLRLQDTSEYKRFESLLQSCLCDTIKVVFPDINGQGDFKIVKTIWNVLSDRYDEMELGDLSIGLSEALGITELKQSSKTTIEEIIERLEGIPKFAIGQESVGTINANSYKDVTITHNLGVNTRVVANLFSSGTAVNIGNTTVTVYDITDTTAKVRIFNNRSSTINPGLDWIAAKI